MSSFDDITARLEALENRTIAVSDLPLSKLQRKLEQGWQPEASTFLLPGSVTRESMAQKLAYGTATITWPGGVPDTTVVVTHDLGVVPTGAVATPHGGVLWAVSMVNAYTNGTLTLAAKTLDGSNPAAATAVDLHWIAFA